MSNIEEDLRQLGRLQSKRKFRKILKFLLIGFLWGRNLDKKTSELTEKIKTRIEIDVAETTEVVDGVALSGTYMIWDRLKDCISRIKAVQAEIACCTSYKALEAKILDGLANTLGGHLEFISHYNQFFVEQRKIDSEQFFALLLDTMHKETNVKDALRKAVDEMKSYSALNFILTNGKRAYILNKYGKDKNGKEHPKYYMMKYLKDKKKPYCFFGGSSELSWQLETNW